MSIKIGVMDSGAGGLTVVKELQKMVPHAQIIYYGDSANCPYGNRSKNEIIRLAEKVIRFFKEQEVDFVCIACNTISTVISDLEKNFDFPLLSIIQSTADFIALDLKPKQIGVVATVDTIESNTYPIDIHKLNPEIKVFGQGSPLLAHLIEEADFSDGSIPAEISKEIDALLKQAQLKDIILGCTHYPIVEDSFQQLYPDIHFINPAYYQALTVKTKFINQKSFTFTNQKESAIIYTSGNVATFEILVKKLAIQTISEIQQLIL